MFGQIIDLLIKQDSERKKILYLIIKVLFSIAITSKLYYYIFGTINVVSSFKIESFVELLFNGKAIICFSLFYLVWYISYDFIVSIFSIFSIWLSSKLYDLLCNIISNVPNFKNEIKKDKSFIISNNILVKLLNITDIIEVENNMARPGTQFYKFYNYLVEIENNKKSINLSEFTDQIALIFQFLFIYHLFNFTFISYSWLILSISIISIFGLLISALGTLVLATLVDVKHSRLLTLMDILDPEIKQE